MFVGFVVVVVLGAATGGGAATAGAGVDNDDDCQVFAMFSGKTLNVADHVFLTLSLCVQSDQHDRWAAGLACLCCNCSL